METNKVFTVVTKKFGDAGRIAERIRDKRTFPVVRTRVDHPQMIVLEGEIPQTEIDPYFAGEKYDYSVVRTGRNPFDLQ